MCMGVCVCDICMYSHHSSPPSSPSFPLLLFSSVTPSLLSLPLSLTNQVGCDLRLGFKTLQMFCKLHRQLVTPRARPSITSGCWRYVCLGSFSHLLSYPYLLVHFPIYSDTQRQSENESIHPYFFPTFPIYSPDPAQFQAVKGVYLVHVTLTFFFGIRLSGRRFSGSWFSYIHFYCIFVGSRFSYLHFYCFFFGQSISIHLFLLQFFGESIFREPNFRESISIHSFYCIFPLPCCWECVHCECSHLLLDLGGLLLF